MQENIKTRWSLASILTSSAFSATGLVFGTAELEALDSAWTEVLKQVSWNLQDMSYLDVLRLWPSHQR